ncbi:MAG: alkaline phosphatase D family protein, partial [Burkholderiales bacterium]
DELIAELAQNRRMRDEPNPPSHSFERRDARGIDRAQITLHRPPGRDAAVKLVATTCRYPGFAFESERVDAASYKLIAASHGDAAAMLMLGDQIYADATANILDTLTTLEKYEERYYDLFTADYFAKAVRSIPCYMTPDDHEFQDAWSKPDDRLRCDQFAAAKRSLEVFQLSHSPWSANQASVSYDYRFFVGKVGVYAMDTLSNKDTAAPGALCLVSNQQLIDFRDWLVNETTNVTHVILATGAVIASGFKQGLAPDKTADSHRAQGLDNWQMFNAQRTRLIEIIEEHRAGKHLLLLSGDYHCAAQAVIQRNGQKIASAVVVPPAYAPMSYLNASIGELAALETLGNYVISLLPGSAREGSGFAVIKTSDAGWDVDFQVTPVADV